MSKTDDDIDIEINGKKVKINLNLREWLVICLTIAFVAYIKFTH